MAEVLSKTNCTWQARKATTTGECKLKIFILSAKAGHSQIQMSQILLCYVPIEMPATYHEDQNSLATFL